MNPTLPPGAPPSKGPRAQRLKKIVSIARPRAVMPVLDQVKERIYFAWKDRGVPEKELAVVFDMRREEVELVIYEMTRRHAPRKLAA